MSFLFRSQIEKITFSHSYPKDDDSLSSSIETPQGEVLVEESYSSIFLEHLREKGLIKPKLLMKMEENSIYTVSKNNKTYALKIVFSSPSYENEIKMLSIASSHPGVVKMYDSFSFISSQRRHYCLLLEYIDGYDLFELRNQIGKVSISLLYEIAKQLVDILSFLHEKNLVHMDIKPENIMYNPSTDVAKLVDFGSSRNTPMGSLYWTGTSGFISPENLFSLYHPPDDIIQDYPFLGNIQHDMNTLKKTDVWSFGVTIFDMLYEFLPYGDSVEDEYRELIMQLRKKEQVIALADVEFTFYEQRKASKLQNLVKKCLTIDWNERPFFDAVELDMTDI